MRFRAMLLHVLAVYPTWDWGVLVSARQLSVSELVPAALSTVHTFRLYGLFLPDSFALNLR